MYLKKYNLSRVSDEQLEKIARILLGRHSINCHPIIHSIRRTSNTIYIDIIDNKGDSYIDISDDCSIDYVLYRKTQDINNQQEIHHLLLETQWIKDSDKLPEEGENIVVKAEGDEGMIYMQGVFRSEKGKDDSPYASFYCCNQVGGEEISIEMITSEPVWWLPADNVVM